MEVEIGLGLGPGLCLFCYLWSVVNVLGLYSSQVYCGWYL